MIQNLQNVDVILHIGLHKTATSFLQNKWSVHRYDLMKEGVFYPIAGQASLSSATREGAQSGHNILTRGDSAAAADLQRIQQECLPNTRAVLISSENFTLWNRDTTAADYLARLSQFKSVKVVLVLRRQDRWIESYYKQVVDGHRDFETRSLEEFAAEEGPKLLDFHSRFSPWREAVGPENFHVISYDDEMNGDEICARILELARVSPEMIERIKQTEVARYDSISAFNTLALRIVNSFNIENREDRVALARAVAEASGDINVTLMPQELYETIQEFCRPINDRIAEEWFDKPVPLFCFGESEQRDEAADKTAQQMFDLFSNTISSCRITKIKEATQAAAAPPPRARRAAGKRGQSAPAAARPREASWESWWRLMSSANSRLRKLLQA